MIQQDQFYTIPDIREEQRLDPRTNNSHSFASTISLNGLNVATVHVKKTSLHVWHFRLFVGIRAFRPRDSNFRI